MSQRRKYGVPLNIPFVDDSSGVMVNGVPLGRPETPPIIRITIPESEVYEPKAGTKKPESQNGDKKSENGEDEVDSSDPKPSVQHNNTEDATEMESTETEEMIKKSLEVPLNKRHRRNSISLPAGLDTLDIQSG